MARPRMPVVTTFRARSVEGLPLATAEFLFGILIAFIAGAALSLDLVKDLRAAAPSRLERCSLIGDFDSRLGVAL